MKPFPFFCNARRRDAQKSGRGAALFAVVFLPLCAVPAFAQSDPPPKAAPSAAQGGLIAVKQIPYRWNMSVAEFKAVSGSEHPIDFLGEYPDKTVVYQANDFVIEDKFLSAVAPRFHLHVYFKNDRLNAFTIIPNNERAAEFVGRQDSWNAFLMLIVACQSDFGDRMKTPGAALKAVRTVPIIPPKGRKDEMDLGFQIQYRTWRARGANYRIAHLFGGDMGLARMQGRLADTPYLAPATQKHTADRTEVAGDVLENFYIAPSLAKAVVANPRYFRAPDPAYWGRTIGMMDYRWNMTEVDVLNLGLGYTPVSVESPKGKSLQLDKIHLADDTPLRWTLQMWFDKKGLREFELRPFGETHNNNLRGVSNTAAFQNELNDYLRFVYGVPPKEWWETTSNVNTKKESRRIQTSWINSPSRYQQYTVLGNDNEYHYGSYYVPSTSSPVFRSYKRVETIPIALPFVIRDRAWNQGKDFHFRQAILSESDGVEMGVIRFQGRQGDKQYYPGTGDTLKTKDAKPSRVLREIYKNYNIPGAPQD